MPEKTYEGFFLLDSNRYSRDPSAAPQQISAAIEKCGGEVLASRIWDDGRKLAYPIAGQKKGTYWLTYFKLDSGRLVELNRNYQLNENMLRHLFVRLDPRVAVALVRVARGEKAPTEPAEDKGETPAAPKETTPEAEEPAAVQAPA